MKALAVLILAVSVCAAQTNGTISGKVEDPSKAPVSDARVTVKSLETGSVRTAMTDGAGNYKVLEVPLGPQEVRFEKAGFKPVVRSGVNLTVGENAVVNAQLEVG